MRRPEELDGLLRATPATLEVMRTAYWRRVAEAGANVAGKVFVDKYPLNTLKLPLIARLFPGAKILVACRDPRDIVLSCQQVLGAYQSQTAPAAQTGSSTAASGATPASRFPGTR